MQTNKYRVLIWGTGKEYGRHLSLIQMNILKGSFEVVGITSNDKGISKLDNFDFINKESLSSIKFDYVLVALEKIETEFWDEAKVRLGDENIDKCIPIRVLSLPYFDFEKYIQIKQRNITVISQMCFGGVCYNSLGLPFLSPTINMAIDDEEEYLDFISNLKYYMNCEVKYAGERYETNLKRNYPVGKVDNVHLLFNHYTDFNQAVELWEKRKKRINWDDLLIIGFTNNRETEIKFNHINVERKKIFVPYSTDLKDSISLLSYDSEKYEGSVAMQANEIASGRNNQISLLSFLAGNENYTRILRKN